MAEETLGERLADPHHEGNCLDLVRFSLAALVILSHSYAVLGDRTLDHEPLVILTHKIGLGTFAVYGFFVVSGFLVSASYQRCQGMGRYLAYRALRVYPGWITALCLTAAVAPSYGAQGDLVSYVWKPLLGRNLPDFPGAFPDNPLHYLNASL